MKALKIIAMSVIGVVVIIAVAAYIFIRTFDLNRYKSYIEQIVFRETGRKLSLNGDAEIGLSLVPTLVLNDVEFANPDWAKNPYMVKLDNLEVKFSLRDLMNKQVKIEKFVLIKPEIYLETSQKGQNNWEFDAVKSNDKVIDQNLPVEIPQINDARAVAAIGLIAEDVRIEDGAITYYNAKDKSSVAVQIKSWDVDIDDEKPIEMDIDLVYDGQDISADLEMSNIDEIMQSGNIAIEGVVETQNIKTGLRGVINDVAGNLNYNFAVDMHNPAGNFGIAETSLLADVAGDVNKATVKINSLNIATNLIKGDVKADWSKAKVDINANLQSDVFNFKTLNKKSMLSSLTWPDLVGNAQALEVIPNDKIPYNYLSMFNGIFNIKIGKLIIDDGLVLKNLILNAKLNNGYLNVSKLDTILYGGKVAATATVNAQKQMINVVLNVGGLQFGELYKNLAKDNGLQVLSGGLMDIDARLATNGATYRKCSENLTGNFTALVDNSVIQTGKLEVLTGGLLGELLKTLKIDTAKNTKLNLECALVNTDIKNGKASFNKGIVFNSDQLQVVSSGSINLLNDKIDFTVSPTLNKLSSGNLTQALASFVRIGGKLDNPTLKLDKTSTVSTVVGTIATNGLYLGGEILLGGDDNLCYNALKGTKFATKFTKKESVKNNVKESYQDVAEQARDAAKEVRDAAKGIFKSLKKSLKGE